MRPYFAIVIDSFREAIASRTLWLLLVLISLALLVIFPLTYTETRTTELQKPDVHNWDGFVAALLEGKDQGKTKPKPANHIWNLLGEEGQKHLTQYKPLPNMPNLSDISDYDKAIQDVRHDINKLFAREDFVDDKSWSGVPISNEGRELRRQARKSEEAGKKLPEEDLVRLSRVYLEAAFPSVIKESEPTSFQMVYALYGEFGDPFPINRTTFQQGIMEVLPWFIDKFVLSIGLLIAILVTASIIPQTFEPGSLHLLLSKPLFRSLIFLTKFLGGCAFVLVSATYLFVGLWLFFGTRLGLWEPRLLWCIPIYGFVFAVYYSVSALAGIWWRNSIVSIMMAILFWGVCYMVGMGKQVMEGSVNRGKLVAVQNSPIGPIAKDGGNQVVLWNEPTKSWQPIFLTKEMVQQRAFLSALGAMPRSVGPLYVPQFKQLVAARQSLSNGRIVLNAATEGDNWRAQEFTAPPSDPQGIFFGPGDAVVLITSDGIYQIEKKLEEQPDAPKILGMSLALTGSGLKRLGPNKSSISFNDASHSYSPESGLWIYNRGNIWHGNFDSAKPARGNGKAAALRLTEVGSATLFDKDRQRATIAATTKAVLIAREEGEVTIVDPTSLAPTFIFPLSRDAKPTAAAADEATQQFFILASSGHLWTYDPTKNSVAATPVSGQGNISGISTVEDGKLMVIDRTNRVNSYQIANWKVEKTYAGASNMYAMVYDRGIQPFYTLFPKPGEMYKPIKHLLTPPKVVKKVTTKRPRGLARILKARVDDPWQPIWSSGLFLVVMLAIGCIYIEWQEF